MLATTQSISSSSVAVSIPTIQTTVTTTFSSTTISIPIPPTGTQDEINAWNQNEDIACSLLDQCLPNLVLLILSTLATV